MMRLRSDLTELCDAALDGRLDQITAAWDPRPALGVVLAAGGYPGDYRKGDVISGLSGEEDSGSIGVHAGTAEQDEQVSTAGGRGVGVCARGDSGAQAQARAYQ